MAQAKLNEKRARHGDDGNDNSGGVALGTWLKDALAQRAGCSLGAAFSPDWLKDDRCLMVIRILWSRKGFRNRAFRLRRSTENDKIIK